MVISEVLAPYQEWKQSFVSEINAQPHPVARGDLFVQKVLQIYYNLSEEDAIDATDCAGPGDKGVDAIYIVLEEEEDKPSAIVVQGKYGSAGINLQIYLESRKFF